jgi:glutathione S-transferase
MRLYGMKGSTCVQRVEMTLNELGLDYEFVNVDLMKGEHKQEAHLERQPFGKIPVLEDGGLMIFESRAIMRYLAGKKENTLFGSEQTPKVIVDNWMEAESNNFSPHISTVVYELMFKKWHDGSPGSEPLAKQSLADQQADPVVVEKALTQLKTVLSVYEKVLSKRDFVAGDEFTLADVTHMPYLNYCMKYCVQDLLDEYPSVKEWWLRVSNRPAWKSVTAF